LIRAKANNATTRTAHEFYEALLANEVTNPPSAAGPPLAAITATRRRTRSAANAGSRSIWSWAQR